MFVRCVCMVVVTVVCALCVWLFLKSSSVHSVRMIVVQCVFVYLGCVSLMCIYVKYLELILDRHCIKSLLLLLLCNIMYCCRSWNLSHMLLLTFQMFDWHQHNNHNMFGHWCTHVSISAFYFLLSLVLVAASIGMTIFVKIRLFGKCLEN